MAAHLTKKAFTENLNTTFRAVVDPPHELNLELFEIVDGHSTDQIEQFALHFRGPLDVHFRQTLLALEHERIGKMELFLVAIGRQPEGMIYEAVFNRFIKQVEE